MSVEEWRREEKKLSIKHSAPEWDVPSVLAPDCILLKHGEERDCAVKRWRRGRKLGENKKKSSSEFIIFVVDDNNFSLISHSTDCLLILFLVVRRSWNFTDFVLIFTAIEWPDFKLKILKCFELSLLLLCLDNDQSYFIKDLSRISI